MVNELLEDIDGDLDEIERIVELQEQNQKPRVKFCWACGRKLCGNHYVDKVIPRWTNDNLPRILHKQCGKWYDKGVDLIDLNVY